MTRELRSRLILLSGTALGMCAAPLVSHALPQGGVVSGGAAEIRDAGAHTVISQGTDRAVIDWNSFDIGTGEQVHFAQPSVNSAILNRIHDQKPSEIMGKLSANGNVFLVNPNGMVFGKGAQVDVGSLVATTADTSNADFMNGGLLEFNQPGNPDASIINHGSITVKEGGLAALVAPDVGNSGIITAKAGTVALAAGDTMTLDFYGDDLLSVAVSDKVKSQSVSNSGTLAGKEVLLTTADAASVIDSVINMDGIVDASSATDVGGTIVFAGQDAEITLGEFASILANGFTLGGTVYIGGEYQGQGNTPTAITTRIAKGAEIRAENGEVIVWADKHTQMDGAIHAKGGFVETSGKQTLGILGSVEAKEWLLDPADVNITGVDANIGGNPNFTPTATAATIDANTIKTALDAGTNVTVTTGGDAFVGSGDITVTNAIGTVGTGNLTLSAYRNVTVNNTITLAGGDLTLRSNNTGIAAGGSVDVGANITTNGGDITIGGGAGAITAGSGFALGANNSVGVVVAAASNVNAGGGNIIINGQGRDVATDNNYGIYVVGTVETSGTGTIDVNGVGGGNGASSSNMGIRVDGMVRANGTGALTVTGTGGNAAGSGSGNQGIFMRSTGSIIGSGGTVNVTGTGSASSGFSNHGINLNNGTTEISNAGGGALTVRGTGGGSGASGTNYGVYTSIAGATIKTTGGSALTVIGQGGNPTGTGASNYGVNVATGTSIQSIGGGTINVTGTGGNNSGGSGATNYGVHVAGSIAGSGGAVSVTGTGGASSGNTNRGVYVNGATAEISNSGAGTLTVTGTGGGTGASNNNHGVHFNAAGATIKTTGSGNLTVTGTAGTGAGAVGIGSGTANSIRSIGTGNIFINADIFGLSAANAVNSVRDITIAPKTPNTGLGIGTGAGVSNLSDATLANLTWGGGYTLTLGSATTGAVDINSAFSFANPVVFRSGAGNDITLSGVLTSTYNTGTSITLASGDDFINNAGATPFTLAGTARRLIYSESPAQDTLGGLTADFVHYSCTYDGTCSGFSATGNGYLYSYPMPSSGGGAATPAPTVQPQPEPIPVTVTAEPEPVVPALPVIDTPATPSAPTTLEDYLADTSLPIPQFLLNALLPSTYVIPAGPVEGPVGYTATSYDFGAPTPGLGNDGVNVDVRHSEAKRSSYPIAGNAGYGTYTLSPEMEALLNGE